MEKIRRSYLLIPPITLLSMLFGAADVASASQGSYAQITVHRANPTKIIPQAQPPDDDEGRGKNRIQINIPERPGGQATQVKKKVRIPGHPGGQATQVKKKVRIPGHPGGQATQVKKKVRIPGHPGGQATQVKKKVRIPGHPGGQATQVKKKVRIPGHPGGQATQVKKKVRIPGHPGGQATQVKKKVRIPGHPGGMQKPEVLGATVKASDDNQTKMTGKEKIATQSSGYAAKKKAAKKKKQILKEKKKNKKKKEKKRDATPAGQVQNIISCATGRVGLGDTLVAQVYTYTKKGYDTVRIAKLLYKNPTPAQRRKALEIMTALESCKKVSDVLAAAVEGAEDIVIPSEHSKEERIKVKDPWFVGGSKDRN